MKNRIFVSVILLFLFFQGQLISQEWLIDLQIAQEEAIENSKPILLVFQGSDWCAPCIKLENEIWKSPAFEQFASESLILLQADFPRRKKNALTKDRQEHNNLLASKYNQNGIFPLVVLIDHKGKVLGETGYKKLDAEEYIIHLKELLRS